MMLVYKAWLESRLRFLLVAGTASTYCLWFLAAARNRFPIPENPAVPFTGFVWAALYGNANPAIFSLAALMLGLGGLQRERTLGTAPFTLALPVRRAHLVASRTLVCLLEVAAIALIPALLLPSFSPLLAGQPYPLANTLEFAGFFVGWGTLWLALGVFWSTILSGYTAAITCLLTPWVYLIAYANVSRGGRRFLWANPFESMSAVAYLKPNTGVFVQPFPWPAMVALLAVSGAVLASAIVLTNRQGY